MANESKCQRKKPLALFSEKIRLDLGELEMDVQKTTINAIRILSAEAIEKAKSGHPGLPMGCAPIAYTLFQNHPALLQAAPLFPC